METISVMDGKFMAHSNSDFCDFTLKADPVEHGFILLRNKDGDPVTNVPHHIVQHSPDGFEWGYGGSGPADLALNILETVLRRTGFHGPKEHGFHGKCFTQAWKFHQAFKWEYISRMGREGRSIPFKEVHDWLTQKERQYGHD